MKLKRLLLILAALTFSALAGLLMVRLGNRGQCATD
jgi:hypothetical protein